MAPDILRPPKALVTNFTKKTTLYARGRSTLDALKSDVLQKDVLRSLTCEGTIEAPSTVVRVASESRKEGFASAGVEDIVGSQSSVGVQERADISTQRFAGIYRETKGMVPRRTIAGGRERVVGVNLSPNADADATCLITVAVWRGAGAPCPNSIGSGTVSDSLFV